MNRVLASVLAGLVALAPVGAHAAPAEQAAPAAQAEPAAQAAPAARAEPAPDQAAHAEPVPAPTVQPTPEPTGHPPGHGMVVAGAVITLGSVAAYGVLGAGLAIGNRAELDIAAQGERDDIENRRDLLSRGELGNKLALVGGITAAVAIVVGIPLIVVGRRRATGRSAQRAAQTQQRRLTLGVQGAGAFVRFRL